jgi:MFS family permease
MSDHKKISFFRHTNQGKVLRYLTANDITYWVMTSYIHVIYALHLTQNITGGSATHVGLSLTMRQITTAVISIPIGKVFDKIKGYVDEVTFLSIASLITGIMYIMLGFATEIWHMYAAMFLIGIWDSVNMNSWRIVFYQTIPEEEKGRTVGVYQTIMSMVTAVLVALSGVLADSFGYEIVFWTGGGIMFLGSILPFLLRKRVRKTQ